MFGLTSSDYQDASVCQYCGRIICMCEHVKSPISSVTASRTSLATSTIAQNRLINKIDNVAHWCQTKEKPGAHITSQKLCFPCLHVNAEFLKIVSLGEVLQKVRYQWPQTLRFQKNIWKSKKKILPQQNSQLAVKCSYLNFNYPDIIHHDVGSDQHHPIY